MRSSNYDGDTLGSIWGKLQGDRWADSENVCRHKGRPLSPVLAWAGVRRPRKTFTLCWWPLVWLQPLKQLTLLSQNPKLTIKSGVMLCYRWGHFKKIKQKWLVYNETDAVVRKADWIANCTWGLSMSKFPPSCLAAFSTGLFFVCLKRGSQNRLTLNSQPPSSTSQHKSRVLPRVLRWHLSTV